MIIVTDSAADLPQEEVRSLGIHAHPLTIQFPEGGVKSEDMTPDEFYKRLKAMEPQIPTTSQPSAGSFASLYRSLAEKQEDILSIHISSGLSGTYQSAVLGASEVPGTKIEVFDTFTLSGSERFHVLAAAGGARLGWEKEKILKRLEEIKAANEIIYTLETLTYLARGGRIGRVQALAGSLLKLKPIIKVDKADGKYSTVGKERTMPRALEGIRSYLADRYGTETRLWVSVMHGQFADQAEILAGMMQEKLNIARLEILRISPVLGVHTGPGIVGAAVVPYDLLEGLV